MDNDINKLQQALEEAKQELELAQQLFSQAVEQELIDEAIYRLEAAECRYAYLLKLAKKECKTEKEME